MCENNLIFKHANLILNRSVLTNNYTYKGPSELTSFPGKTFKRNTNLIDTFHPHPLRLFWLFSCVLLYIYDEICMRVQ